MKCPGQVPSRSIVPSEPSGCEVSSSSQFSPHCSLYVGRLFFKADRLETRVVATMNVNPATQAAVLLKPCPAATTGWIALVIAVPSEFDIGPPVAFLVQAIHPTVHGDKSELTGSPLAELDEGRTNEVDGLLLPKIHCGDAPFSCDPHRSSLLSCDPYWIS